MTNDWLMHHTACELKKISGLLNASIKQYLTDDVFPQYYPLQKKQYWRNNPIRLILTEESNERQFHTISRSNNTTQNILVNLLLKLRGVRNMDDTTNKSNYLDIIKQRSTIAMEREIAKKQLIEDAKKQGWVGLVLEEVDFDLKIVYDEILEQFHVSAQKCKQNGETLGKDELALANFLRSIRNDKAEMVKFMETMKLKKYEIDARNGSSKKSYRHHYSPETSEHNTEAPAPHKEVVLNAQIK